MARGTAIPHIPKPLPLLSSPATPGWGRHAIAVVCTLVIGGLAVAPLVRADAPALAVTLAMVDLLVQPTADSAVLARIPADTQIEMTGVAVPDYVEAIFERQRGWIAASQLDAGSGRGVPLATATRDLPIRDAPLPEARILGIVPLGGTLILTGAETAGHVAAAYRGTGGWIDADGLRRGESATPSATDRCRDAVGASTHAPLPSPGVDRLRAMLADRAPTRADQSSVSPRRSAA